MTRRRRKGIQILWQDWAEKRLRVVNAPAAVVEVKPPYTILPGYGDGARKKWRLVRLQETTIEAPADSDTAWRRYDGSRRKI